MFFLIFLIFLSILIIVHEFGHFLAAKKMGVRVERFSLGFGPKVFSVRYKDTEYAICAFLFGGYVKMAGDDPREKPSGAPWEYFSQPISKRAAIIIAGPALNYILAFLIFFSIFFMFGTPKLNTEIGELIEDFPAKIAGLRTGDRIVAIDGESVKRWDEMAKIIHQRTDGSLTLTIERKGKQFLLELWPKVEEKEDLLGNKTKVAMIGIAPVIIKYNPIESFCVAGNRLFSLSAQAYKGIYSLIRGRVPLQKSIMGIVGIYVVTGEMAKLGILPFFQWMALLSLFLTIFNLLPFPVLDGGHLVFLALEKLRGRSLSPKIQDNIQQVALFILITLSIFVVYNDVVNFRIVERLSEWWQGR